MVTTSRLLIGGAVVLTACASSKRLVLPAEMKPSAVKAEAKPKDAAAPEVTGQKYVMRVADSGRVWEFELPQDGSSYEMRVPLANGRVPETLTAADRELLSEGGNKPAAALDAKTVAAQQSLLSGLAQITELYKDKRFELALISATELESAYPNEARVHAMKGSLYKRLGKPSLSRASYRKALELDPTDVSVAEALREPGENEVR